MSITFVTLANPEFAHFNLHLFEVVSRYRDPQLQVAENYSYLLNLRPNTCKSWYLNFHFARNKNDLIGNKTTVVVFRG